MNTIKNAFALIGYLALAMVAVAALWQISAGQGATAAVTERPAPLMIATGTGSGGVVGEAPAVVPVGVVGHGGNTGN